MSFYEKKPWNKHPGDPCEYAPNDKEILILLRDGKQVIATYSGKLGGIYGRKPFGEVQGTTRYKDSEVIAWKEIE